MKLTLLGERLTGSSALHLSFAFASKHSHPRRPRPTLRALPPREWEPVQQGSSPAEDERRGGGGSGGGQHRRFASTDGGSGGGGRPWKDQNTTNRSGRGASTPRGGGDRDRPQRSAYSSEASRPAGIKQQPPRPADQLARLGAGKTSNFFSAKSWTVSGADDTMAAALSALGISRPSHIQAAALAALSPAAAAAHVVLADYAGSGKTLAYLVPLVQALKAAEAAAGGPMTRPHSPAIVVVVPTQELAAQVLRVCRALSSQLRFRSVAVTGGRPLRTQRDSLAQGVDVLVGTPGRMTELLASGDLKLEHTASVVFDEADVLLAFAEQVDPLRHAAPKSAQFVLVTATLPSDAYAELELQFPGLVAALGPGLHRTAPGVTEQIVDCSGGDEITEESGVARKTEALLAALQERRAQRTIVFCNKIETCRKVENSLNRELGRGAEVLPYHTAVAADRREGNLQRFLAPPESESALDRRGSQQQYQGSGFGDAQPRMILVCTDRASRGVDSAFVDHVILFDFPRDPSEYVRRVGRTARGAGGEGLVSILVLGRQVKLAQDVVGRNIKGQPVHALPAVMPASRGNSSNSSGNYQPRGE